MATLLEQISSQLGDETLQKIGQKLGLDAEASKSAIESALPVLLGAMARNTQNTQGASALASALDRDHDGSVLNNLDAFLQAPEQGKGAGILNHVLGAQRGRVEQYVSKSSGLNSGNTGQLLEMLAPLVMGSLGQQKKAQGLDAGGLAGMLGQLLGGGQTGNASSGGGQTGTAPGNAGQASAGARQAPGNAGKAAKSPQQQLLESLLDSDKDGDIKDDLLNLGGKLLGGMFGKK